MSNDLKDFVPWAEEEQEKPYAKFYLESNPFPAIQILYEYKFIEFEEFTTRIQNILRQFYENGRTNRLVIKADNRGGKTHALLYIKYIINNYIFPQYHYLRAVYIKNPPDVKGGEKGTFHDTYQEIVDNIGKEFFDKICLSISKKSQPDGETLHGLPNIDKFLRENGFTDDFSICLDTWWNNKSVRDLVWSWIRGDKLNKSEIETLKIRRNIASSSYAISILNEIIRCGRLALHENFGICLLIDEFEELTRQTTRDRIRYLADIRNLIDAIPQGLILILGMAPYGWKAVKDYGALEARLEGNMLELKKIDDEADALKYAREYLKWGRWEYCMKHNIKKLDEIEEKIKKIGGNPDYYPFTEKKIIDIFEQGRKSEIEISRPGVFLEELSKKMGEIVSAQ